MTIRQIPTATQRDHTWPTRSAPTRAAALAAGALVAASPEIARRLGWAAPVAYAAAVHADLIAWSGATEAAKTYPTSQDAGLRERDVLFMAAAALRRCGPAPAIAFTVYAVPAAGPGVLPVVADLVVITGPGDTGEDVVTIIAAHQQ